MENLEFNIIIQWI